MPRPAELTIELMRTFLVVVEEGGNATRAAQRLEIGQPSMSRRLDHLREAGPVLTRPWLVQEGKTCLLTEEGRKVLSAVRNLVGNYDDLRTFIERPPQVAFSCGQEAAATFVHEAVLAYRKRPNSGRLCITQMRGKARIEGVANGSLDLALVTDDETAIEKIARRPLYTQLVGNDPLVLVCVDKPDVPWSAAIRALTPAKLRPRDLIKLEAPWILPERDAGIREQLDQALRNAGVRNPLPVELEVGGWRTILTYVADGMGVGLVSRDAAQRWPSPLIVRELDPRSFPGTELRLIARRRSGDAETPDLSEEGRVFLEDLLAALKEHWKLAE